MSPFLSAAQHAEQEFPSLYEGKRSLASVTVKIRMEKYDQAVATAHDALREAEAELEASQSGSTFQLNLKKKMGMVVNHDGTISKVVDGGQAEISGVHAGCKITGLGGLEVTSLDELKAAIKTRKSCGDTECELIYNNPRRFASARARAASSKASLAKAVAARATFEEENARLKAEAEAAAAVALAEENERRRLEAEAEAAALAGRLACSFLWR